MYTLTIDKILFMSHYFCCVQALLVVKAPKKVEIGDLDDLLRMEREKEGDTGLLDADTAGVS